MADQQGDQTSSEQTVVIPTWKWPTVEPDPPTAPHSAHIDYLDTPDGPMQAPPDGVYSPAEGRPPSAQPSGGDDGSPPDQQGQHDAADDRGQGPRRVLVRRTALAGLIAFGVLALLYGAELALASGDVPRGTTVAGVPVGGLDRAAAEQRLRTELTPRLSRPVEVQAGDVRATVDPAAAGLQLDWSATLDRAGDQPLNPVTRLRSLFTGREVGTVTSTDRAMLTAAVEALRATTDRESTEGTIRFEGADPVPVDPRPGQLLDVPRAVNALEADWAGGGTVELPVTSSPVRTTPESVRAALDGVARPAVSGPVVVTGDGADATLTPDVIAGALSFEAAQDGTLTPKYDNDKIVAALRPQLATTEQPGTDATVVIEGGRPVVKPSVDGHGIDWGKSLAGLPDVLRGTADRSLAAVYDHQPAKFTTEQARRLGIREVIGEFTTRGFATDSGVNIRTIAAEVNGALIKPGETFSLNGYTGPRGTAQGYIEAGIIEKGRPSRAIGGGCSQFATTLYNASYFAGMTDITHKEHSFYISRYPEGREATVFEGAIDLAFRNDAPTGALIETMWTPTTITVRIWGTKNYDVESITGARTNFTEPETVTIPHGEPCTAGTGAQGFTVTNTRVVRDARTGVELKRTSRTVVYNPIPKIICEPAPPPPG
ncbi:MAG TPA: VanW family protein [Kribbellaceae bacterium]